MVSCVMLEENLILLDSLNHHRSGLSGKVTDSLEVESAADSRDVGERLEDLRVASAVTVIEQDHRGEGSLAWHQSGHNVSLGIVDVGCVGSSSLGKSVTNLMVGKWSFIRPGIDQCTEQTRCENPPRPCVT